MPDDRTGPKGQTGTKSPKGRLFKSPLRLLPLIGLFVSASYTAGGSAFTPARAGADQVSTLQAQAAQLSAQLNREGAQVAADQQRYEAESEQAAADAASLAATQAQLNALVNRETVDAKHLRDAAVAAYVHGGTSGDPLSSLFGSQSNQQATQEYTAVVVGNVADTLDALHSDQQQVQVQRAQLQSVTAADQAAQSEAAQALGQSRATQQELSYQSAQVTGQLAVAVQQEQAAQAAAAAAAVQARADAAARAQAAASANPVLATVPSGNPGIGAWQRVAICEEGGANDPTFGYFGIEPSTWASFGGTQYSPTAGGATEDEQVVIANRISGGNVPDANGCGSW